MTRKVQGSNHPEVIVDLLYEPDNHQGLDFVGNDYEIRQFALAEPMTLHVYKKNGKMK